MAQRAKGPRKARGRAADRRRRLPPAVQEPRREAESVSSAAFHTPPCAVCRSQRPGDRSQWPLTHGVTVWLCDHHGSEEFRNRRRGRELAEQLIDLWAKAGCLTQRRAGAIRTYVRQRERAQTRTKPGSYSWPNLRREAEQRFALGHHPRTVIRELRDRYAHNDALPPSPRTMRRWFADARWIEPTAVRSGKQHPTRAVELMRTAELILLRILDGMDALADTRDMFGNQGPPRQPRYHRVQ